MVSYIITLACHVNRVESPTFRRNFGSGLAEFTFTFEKQASLVSDTGKEKFSHGSGK